MLRPHPAATRPRPPCCRPCRSPRRPPPPARRRSPVSPTRRRRSSRPPVRSASSTPRSEEHTSELQSLMRISYAVFCLKKKKNKTNKRAHQTHQHRVDYTSTLHIKQNNHHN